MKSAGVTSDEALSFLETHKEREQRSEAKGLFHGYFGTGRAGKAQRDEDGRLKEEALEFLHRIRTTSQSQNNPDAASQRLPLLQTVNACAKSWSSKQKLSHEQPKSLLAKASCEADLLSTSSEETDELEAITERSISAWKVAWIASMLLTSKSMPGYTFCLTVLGYTLYSGK